MEKFNELLEKLNKYCAKNDVYDLDYLSKELDNELNELKQYNFHYVATVDTDEHRWYVLAENVYEVCIDGIKYYIGVWEVETLKSEAMSVSDCGVKLRFYEMEEYTTVSYRRKK